MTDFVRSIYDSIPQRGLILNVKSVEVQLTLFAKHLIVFEAPLKLDVKHLFPLKVTKNIYIFFNRYRFLFIIYFSFDLKLIVIYNFVYGNVKKYAKFTTR